MKALSTLFFPQQDVIYVQGPDNSSYWLILFVKSDLLTSWKFLYYVGVIVEVLFLLAGIYFHGRGTFLISKHKALHPNMILIYTNYYFTFQSGSLARLLLTLFETRLIRLQYLGSFPVPHLGVIRMFSVVQVICYQHFATLERIFATILVKDYERLTRHRFAIFLIVILDFVVLGVSYLLVAGVLNGYICCLVAIWPCVGCVGVLRILLKINRKRLAKISDTLRRSANNQYSLSLRMQLRENLWTLQKIEFGMYIIVFALISMLALILIPIFVLDDSNEVETLQWCMWAANILIAVLITGSVPMATFAVANHTGDSLPMIARWYMRICGQDDVVVIIPVEKKPTEEYFHQLHNQWDRAMLRR